MVSDSTLATSPPTLPRASLVLRPVSRTCSVAVSAPEVICRRATDWWPERRRREADLDGAGAARGGVGRLVGRRGRVVGHERGRGQRAAAARGGAVLAHDREVVRRADVERVSLDRQAGDGQRRVAGVRDSSTGTTLLAAGVTAATDGKLVGLPSTVPTARALMPCRLVKLIVGVVEVAAVLLVVVVLDAAGRGGEDRPEVQPVIRGAVGGHREAGRARAGVRQFGSPASRRRAGSPGRSSTARC